MLTILTPKYINPKLAKCINPYSSLIHNQLDKIPKTGTTLTKLEARLAPITSMPMAKKTYENAVERIPKYPIKSHSLLLQERSHGDSAKTKGMKKNQPTKETQVIRARELSLPELRTYCLTIMT